MRSARRYAARCHARQRRQSDGAALIEHPLEVARLLRDAGCSETVIAAGLLHDVLENTHIDVAELTTCFGSAVADLVKAVSDDASITSYRQRKQLLRQQVRRAGHDTALLFAADKIAKVRELPALVSRDRARFDATPHTDRPARSQLEQAYLLRLEHYHESLIMLQHIAPHHPLTQRLADELRDCQTPSTAWRPPVSTADRPPQGRRHPDRRAAWTGCVAGVLTRDEFGCFLTEAGLIDIEIP